MAPVDEYFTNSAFNPLTKMAVTAQIEKAAKESIRSYHRKIRRVAERLGPADSFDLKRKVF